MDTQAITDCEVASEFNDLADLFREKFTLLLKAFAKERPTPQRANNLENDLHEQLRELVRRLIEWVCSQLEPEIEELPGTASSLGRVTSAGVFPFTPGTSPPNTNASTTRKGNRGRGEPA